MLLFAAAGCGPFGEESTASLLYKVAHAEPELEKVPADMVTTSGSGLDPHITLRNARYQLDRVVAARAASTGADPVRVRTAITGILSEHAFSPPGGLAGL